MNAKCIILKERLNKLQAAVSKRHAEGKNATDAQYDRLTWLSYDIGDASCAALDEGNEALNDWIVTNLEEPADELRIDIEEGE